MLRVCMSVLVRIGALYFFTQPLQLTVIGAEVAFRLRDPVKGIG
jgi:hypothetical protein